MTALSISLSPRTAATAIGPNWFRMGLFATVFLFGLAPRPAAAQGCPGTITTSLVLSSTITATASSTNPCITLGADGLMVNLGSFSIDVRALGDAGVAIDTGITNNAAILATGGQIMTAYTSSLAGSAIESAGGANLTITGVKIVNFNAPGPAACTLTARNQNWGAGITLAGITSANISTNTIECYQKGISISGTAIARKASALVSGNTLTNDQYNNYLGASAVFALGTGLVLSNSSGWTIQNNSISFDGSLNASLTCSDLPNNPTTDPTDCSPAVELLAGSSGNLITGNTVSDNFSPGIFTSSTTSGNKILNNTLATNPFGDLWDAAPAHSNTWRGNACQVDLGNVAPQRCPH